MATRLVRGISLVFLAQILGMATKGGLIILLSRYLLEPAEYGRLFLALSVLGFAMLFANLGFEKAGARYVTEYRESAPELVPTALRRTLLYNGTAIVVVGVVLVVFHGSIATLVGEPAIAGLLLAGVLYVATKSLKGTVVVLFQGFDRMDRVALVNVVTSALLLVAVPVMVLAEGLEGAVLGYAIAYAAGAAVGLALIRRRLSSVADGDTVADEDQRRSVAAKILRYSVPLTFTMSANVVNSRTDRILLSVFRGPVAIAYYTLGKQIADVLITPARSMGLALSPTYGAEKSGGDLRDAARLYEQSFVYTTAFYGPAAAGVVLVAHPTIRLVFGPDYAGAAPILQLFSVFVIVRAFDTITSDALDYLGRARARAWAKGGSAVGNVVLNLVLIPPYGVVGAAVATMLTYGAYVAIELFVIADELPLDGARLRRTALVVTGITVGMSVVVYPLTEFVSGLPSLAAVIAAGGAVWLALTALSGVVSIGRLYRTFQ